MMRFHRGKYLKTFSLLLLLNLVHLSCTRQAERSAPIPETGIEEIIGTTAILRLQASLAILSPDLRIAAYFLSQALLAGRDIPGDQIYPRQAESRLFLEKIGANISYGASEHYVQPFLGYLKSVWIHGGFYDLQTGRKIPPIISDRELYQLMFVALANTGGQLGSLLEINLKARFIADTLLNPLVDSCLFPEPHPNVGAADPILITGFYDRLPLSKAYAFPQRHPRNSRLEKRDGKLIERVYRAGDEELAPGPFASELERVIENLEKSRLYLPPQRVPVVDLLIQHFRTGDLAAFDSAAMLYRSTSAPLDFILGFTDQRYDRPLHHKGLWTGLLFVADDSAQTKIDRLSDLIPQLLVTFPVKIPNSETIKRSIKAAQLLTAVGADAPLCPIVYRDPPYVDSEKTPSQSLIFTNVLEAQSRAWSQSAEAECCIDSTEKASAERYASEIAFAEAALSELIGISLESQKEKTPIKTDYIRLVLQETLALAARLWVADAPHLIDANLFSSAEAQAELYRSWVRKYTLNQFTQTTIGPPVQTDGILMARLMAKGSVKLKEQQGKVFIQVVDTQLMRQHLAEIAVEIQKLLTYNNSDELRKYSGECVRSYGQLNDEIHRTWQNTNGFIQAAYIFPLVQAKFNPMGGIEEVHLEQPKSFMQEKLIYSGIPYPNHKK